MTMFFLLLKKRDTPDAVKSWNEEYAYPHVRDLYGHGNDAGV